MAKKGKKQARDEYVVFDAKSLDDTLDELHAHFVVELESFTDFIHNRLADLRTDVYHLVRDVYYKPRKPSAPPRAEQEKAAQ